MPRVVISDLTKGQSLRDPQLIKDNQFELLKNFYYNQDKRLQTRRGIEQYFPVVPDTVVTIDALNATTGWSGIDDLNTIATGTAIRGTFALQFNITASTGVAVLTKTTLSANISSAKGYIGFWFYVPTGFNTELTSVQFVLGNNSSNSYSWTLPALLENTNQFIELSFTDATTSGTPNDATISYAELGINYTGSYASQTGIKIDDLQAYSSTYTKPVTSYFFNKNEATGAKIAMCAAGTNMFLYDETANAWERIDSGLSEFETLTGRTTQRTRWGFFAYNGSGTMEVGMCNGVDSYRKWDGTNITQYAAQPKCRYFLIFEDRIVSGGEDAHPLTLYYTNAASANINTLNTNNVDVGNESDGRINGLFELVQSVLVGKTEKIYYVDFANTTALPIDAQNGLYSHRVTHGVGNAILYQTKNGIDNLQQKANSTGAAAIEGQNYTEDLQTLTKQITSNQLNANCGGYIKELNNYYFSFDVGNDNVPETHLIYSSLIGKTWTQYTYPALYQYGYYIDSNNAYNHLICSGNAGLIYKIETGFDDDGALIEYEFKTKAYDLGDPSNWKDYEYIDIFGLKNEGSEMELEVIVDGDTVYSATLDDTFLTSASAAVTIGSDAVGSESTGGGGMSSTSTDIDLFPFKIRLGAEIFASGQTVQIRGVSESTPMVMTLDRFQIKYGNVTDDLFPIANFA